MDTFSKIYHNNQWRGKQSRSGPGSSVEATVVVRRELPLLIKELGVKSMIDCPCGDLNWMKYVQLPCDYLGIDIVPELIENNKRRCKREFLCADARGQKLPSADLLFSRDFLVHLSEEDIWRVVKNVKESGTQWWLMTHFTDDREYIFAKTGSWRPINFCKPPFSFPEPQKIIVEGHPTVKDKSLALWNVESLPCVEVDTTDLPTG